MALTVPTGPAPATGWPLVVYAHGTGGSFRSHINEGVAARMANVEGKKVAVLGIDQVGHGTRRGDSTAQPQNVFFNFTNPAAARGNVLQGAADQLALVRFAKGLSLAAADSPTTQAIKFDRITFWGHSQGATEGTIAMPYTSDVAGSIFSGAGGSLIDSLLNKKNPVNLAAVAPAILSETPANVNASHPVLAMFQNAIDPADPLDHAVAIGAAPMHVFVPYGQNDTYAPTATQYAYIVAAGLGVAKEPASVTKPDDLGKATLPIPVTANSRGTYTFVTREYAPTDYDGHFVVYKDPDAKNDADRFLVDVLSSVIPKLGR
jgi:pimeloyl-ACP methyl ester carboxylesterase